MKYLKAEVRIEEMVKEPLIQKPKRKGGLRALPFIIANQAVEKLATYGLLPNMILYLTTEFGMQAPTATNLIFLWVAASNFTPTFAAFLADSYVGRFPIIVFGSLSTLLGMLLLWLTTMVPKPSPDSCDQITGMCTSPTTSSLTLLYCSLCLMSIGSGGIRSSSLAFGVDQLSQRDSRNGMRVTYLNWCYASAAASCVIGMFSLAYIQLNFGWKIAFGLPPLFLFLSTLSFLLASPLYIKIQPKTNIITSFARAISASFKNRHFQLPPPHFSVTDATYYSEEDSTLLIPTEKLRFLNKACLITNPLQQVTEDGRARNPWSLCTVDQVEALKSLLRIAPIWVTGVIKCVNDNHNNTFLALQASHMNRNITPHLEIPAASVSSFMIISIFLWIALYDRILVPLASRIRGTPVRLRVKQRMGIGLFVCCLSTASLAIVEGIRRNMAIKEESVKKMSVLWLMPRLVLDGIADALNAVGQNEFYLSEIPQSMSSLASTIFGLGISAANLVASLVLSVVDKASKCGGNPSWVSSNINEGHYDYYYWLLFAFMCLNFLCFLRFSKAYGPCKENRPIHGVKEEDEEALLQ